MLSIFNFSRSSINFIFSTLITLAVIAPIIAAPTDELPVENVNSSFDCPPSPTSINIGTTVNESLSTTDCVSQNFYFDSYSFTAIAGQRIRISMNSTAFNTVLQLFDPNRVLIEDNDNGGGGTNSLIIYTPTVTGTYFILALSASPNQTGAYTLNLINEVVTPQSLQRPPADFDGDGKTDLSIFRPSVGEWWYLRSSDGSNRTFQFGNSSDKLVPADYTGDEKTDIAFFRPSTNEWFILRSENNSFYSFPFGASGDVPVPADYDGDRKADAAVYRPSNQTWFIQRSSGGVTIESFGISGDVPVTADYDGDGKSDIAIYRPSQGQWWQSRSSQGVIVYQFGVSTDKPVQGDYTGDGKADVAFFRPSTNEWFVLRSENNSFYSFPFGAANDIPSPGDYDGDRKFDAAVFRPSSNTWFVQRSTSGTLIQGFGVSGDKPIPNVFVP
jgi:putative transposon-encoded protein